MGLTFLPAKRSLWIMAHKPKQFARVEDDALLRGRGRFVDDAAVAGQAVGLFVRSPHAHARITAIDVAVARKAPGVIAVLTGPRSSRLGVASVSRHPPIAAGRSQPARGAATAGAGGRSRDACRQSGGAGGRRDDGGGAGRGRAGRGHLRGAARGHFARGCNQGRRTAALAGGIGQYRARLGRVLWSTRTAPKTKEIERIFARAQRSLACE